MSRRNDISVLLGALAIALAAAPAAAEPLPVDSWGRAGVAYETYRNDSLECGLLGYNADVSQTEQAQAFVTATRRFEAIDSTSFSAGSPDLAIEPPRHPARTQDGRAPPGPGRGGGRLPEGARLRPVPADRRAARGAVAYRPRF